MTPTAWLRAHAVLVSAVAAAAAVAAFSTLLDQNLTGPLTGLGDVAIWEPMGAYLAKNLHFVPWPHLDLTNDQGFFPYGVNHVFQPWGFERDGFFAVLFTSFGPGPWLQVYYLLTLFITAVGAFAILRRDFGEVRAALGSVLSSFFNFYAVNKYPWHMHICVVHWTTLSLLADFVIVRRIVLREPLGLRLVFLRLTLLCLSFGQDLGYICGFALTSFTIAMLFSAFIVIGRGDHRALLHVLFEDPRRELRQHKVALSFLACVFLGASFFYLPLAAQVAREARSFDFRHVPNGYWFDSAWRLFIPYLPGFNPAQNPFKLSDLTEGSGGGSVGWTFLVLGIASLWTARRNWLVHVPTLILFVLCFFYNPSRLPTLKIFPWFAFSRVASRVTVIFPILITTWTLTLRLDAFAPALRKWLVGATVVLAALEFRTAYTLWPHVSSTYPDRFFAYMDMVRREPGQGLLDWPFCVTGGNGVGASSRLCPYYPINSNDFALQTYHAKKVVGQYFGRLHPSQIAPLLRAHFAALFVPDDKDFFKARGQTRCFDEHEWALFTEFFALNDFAGLQLHKSLLPAGCVETFYERFGRAAAEVRLTDGDDLAFIPKPAALRARVDEALGKSFNLRPHLHGAADLIGDPAGLPLDEDGLSDVGEEGPAKWRWGLGPKTTLGFSVQETRSLLFRFTFLFATRGQEIQVLVDGTPRARFVAQARIEILSSDWNGKDGRRFDSDDERPISVRFTELALE